MNGVSQFVGDTTPPGAPTGITCSSAWGSLYVSWDGTLDGGIPADFAYVSIMVDGTEIERLTGAGTAVREDIENGSTVHVTAIAYDSARNSRGELSPNASEPFGPVEVEISDERAEIDQAVQDAEAAAEKAEQAADEMAGQITDIKVQVEGLQGDIDHISTQVTGAVENASAALEAASSAQQDLDGFKTTVSQTYETKADADSAMAQEVLDRNSAIEQSATKIQQTVSQTYTTKTEASEIEGKADAAQAAASSANSAASAAQSTANAAQDDLDSFKGTVSTTYATKSSLTQTADSIRSEVSETYVTKTDADSDYQPKGDYLTDSEASATYATKSSLTQASDSILSEVEKTYQSKDGMSSYYTKTEVDQKDSAISSTVSEVRTTADSALTKATTVEQTASGLSVRLTQAEKDVDAAQSTADSASKAASAASTDAANALNKANGASSAASEAKTAAQSAQSAANTANTNASEAKTAAANAQSTASAAQSAAADAAKTATNYLNFSSGGLTVGDMTESSLGKNVNIGSDSVDIRNDQEVLASFSDTLVELGNDSDSSSISFCNRGSVTFSAPVNNNPDIADGMMTLMAPDGVMLYAERIETSPGTEGQNLINWGGVGVGSDKAWMQVTDYMGGSSGINVGSSSIELSVLESSCSLNSTRVSKIGSILDNGPYVRSIGSSGARVLLTISQVFNGGGTARTLITSSQFKSLTGLTWDYTRAVVSCSNGDEAAQSNFYPVGIIQNSGGAYAVLNRSPTGGYRLNYTVAQ